MLKKSTTIDFKCGKLNCAINPSLSQIVFCFIRRVGVFFLSFIVFICYHIQTCKTCLKLGTPTFYSLPVAHDLCFSGSVSQSLVTVFHFVDKIWILSLRLKPHKWYMYHKVLYGILRTSLFRCWHHITDLLILLHLSCHYFLNITSNRFNVEFFWIQKKRISG